MPPITFADVGTDGATTASVTPIDNNFALLQALLNGGLDKDNLLAAAGILPAQLAPGSAGTVLQSNGAVNSFAFPPGYAYVRNLLTGNVGPISATTAAAAATVIAGSAFTYDGTECLVEFFVPNVFRSGTTVVVTFVLYDGAAQVCNLGKHAIGDQGVVVNVRAPLTPAAGSHTYTAKAFVDTGTGATFQAGNGTAGNFPNGYLRVVKA